MSELTSDRPVDRGGLRGLFDRLQKFLPARLRRGTAVVPVVRLSGVIGAVTPLRPGMTLAGVAKMLERAFATKNATIIADAGQADSFAIEVECSHTHVDTSTGLVTMREGSNDKQVAAGSSATAGNVEQSGCKPCLRPGSAPGVAIAGWPWLILVAAGVAGAAVFLGTTKNDTTLGGGTIIVSPTR